MSIYCWSYVSNAGARVWFAQVNRYTTLEQIILAGEGNTQMQAVLNLLAKIGGCV